MSNKVSFNIHDKQMSIYTDYLVYFDDICINDFVLEYQVNIGVQIGLGSATVSLLYAPSFDSYDGADGIENGTAVRIFANNMFSRKYDQVFDGVLKQKIVNRVGGADWSISFTAVDHFYWMQRIIAPISIPFSSAVSPGERLKWKAQSIDPQKVATIETVKAGSLKGKTVTEFFDLIKQASFKNSRVYSEQNTVANFDAAIDRVEIMGDIDEDLKSKEVIDFVIDSNSVFTDTAYVALNNAASTLLMEFYQDRDGIIRVKPPYWNEPVLRSHVIDPLMIISASKQTNWNNFYTRVITTGGLEEWQNTGNTTSKTDFLTPVGAYVGCYEDKSKANWADYLSEGTAVSSFDEDFLSKHNKMKKGGGGDSPASGDYIPQQKCEVSEETLRIMCNMLMSECSCVTLQACKELCSASANRIEIYYNRELTDANLRWFLSSSGFFPGFPQTASGERLEMAKQAISEVIVQGRRVLPRYVCDWAQFSSTYVRPFYEDTSKYTVGQEVETNMGSGWTKWRFYKIGDRANSSAGVGANILVGSFANYNQYKDDDNNWVNA